MEGTSEQAAPAETMTLHVDDVPEEIVRQAKATAVLARMTLKAFLTAALVEHTRRVKAELEQRSE